MLNGSHPPPSLDGTPSLDLKLASPPLLVVEPDTVHNQTSSILIRGFARSVTRLVGDGEGDRF